MAPDPWLCSTTRWLNEDERWLAAARLSSDNIGSAQGHGATSGHWYSLKESLSDWRTWMMTIIFMMITGAQTIVSNSTPPLVFHTDGSSCSCSNTSSRRSWVSLATKGQWCSTCELV